MKSLFVRIFLSYWVAQALFLVLAILTTIAFRPQRDTSVWGAIYSKALNEAVEAYHRGGQAAAQSYLDDLDDSQQIQAFLYNDQNVEVSKRAPKEWADYMVRGGVDKSDDFWGKIMPKRFVRQSVTASDGKRYTLLVQLPRGPRVFFGPRGFPGLGILIAVVSSGLICWFLARSLTSPVVALRAATQKLAGGDLTARADEPGPRRNDELAGLVRDFNSMAERIENLISAQSRLLNDISHELRSPLARLSVALGLARQRTGGDAQVALERIDLETNRLNELIGRLLTLSRLESGSDTMQTFPLDLGELVRDVAKDANFEAQNRGCGVNVSAPEDFVVWGDPVLLHSAIENVVRNAIRHTHAGTTVEVELSRAEQVAGSMATLRVIDSGPGVPPDTLNKLFRPFYRIEADRDRQTGGVGLGLAITERAVRLHGGTVKASNRPEGGLELEIQLPMTEAPETVSEPQPAAQSVNVES